MVVRNSRQPLLMADKTIWFLTIIVKLVGNKFYCVISENTVSIIVP